MKFTRAIALCALTLAIALAIGAISPYQPYASAGSAPEHAPWPTPALATAEPAAAPATAEPAAAPAAAPQVVYVQLPPQVVYIQQPAPQVVEQPAPQVVEQPQVEQPQVEQPQVEQPQVEQPQVEQPQVVGQPVTTAGEEYQRRRLDAINAGAAYRPRTR